MWRVDRSRWRRPRVRDVDVGGERRRVAVGRFDQRPSIDSPLRSKLLIDLTDDGRSRELIADITFWTAHLSLAVQESSRLDIEWPDPTITRGVIRKSALLECLGVGRWGHVVIVAEQWV